MHSPETAPDLTVVSLNIAGFPLPRYAHARAEAFCRLINETDATMINLQEVHGYPLFWHLRKRLRSFPFVAFKPGIFGPKAGLVTFSKLPIQDVTFFSLLPATRSLDRRQRPKQAIFESHHKGVLITQLANRPVTFMNVHLNPNKDGDWSIGNRFYSLHKAQLVTLNELADQARFRDSVVIMSGDFNLAKDCDLFPAFAREGGWTDVFDDDASQTFHAEFLSPGRTAHCIDYLLVRDPLGRFKADDASLIFKEKVMLNNKKLAYVSDHMGLRGSFNCSQSPFDINTSRRLGR